MDILDSRDLIDTCESLAIEIAANIDDAFVDYRDVLEHNYGWLKRNTTDMESEIEEMFSILKLNDDVNSSEWNHGLCLIKESYFTEYCQDMLEDCGDIPKDIPHYIVIDWEETADNLKVDYSEVEYQGYTYYYRDC